MCSSDLISELVKRAGVSRAAFYRNYDSKEEILESVFKRSVHNIMEQLSHYDVKTDLYLVWVHLFRAAKKEAKIIQFALDYHLEKIFVQAMQEFLEKYHGKSKGVSSYLHSFWSSAIVSVLLKWIKDGMKVPAEKITTYFIGFVAYLVYQILFKTRKLLYCQLRIDDLPRFGLVGFILTN